MAEMGKAELTPMVAVDPFHLPQSEPLALTVNNKEKEGGDLKEFRQEQEEEEENVNIKQPNEKKTGFTFTVADDNGENQSFTLQVTISLSFKVLFCQPHSHLSCVDPSHPVWLCNVSSTDSCSISYHAHL